MTWHFWRTAWQTHSVSPFVFSISIRLLALDQNRFCCRRITIMIAGDTGSCLCKGPWSKLAVTIPNVWSSYIHCHDLLWNICGLICLHVLAILHACLFPQMQRERERRKLICHISSSNACAKEPFFILNFWEPERNLLLNANSKPNFPQMDGGGRTARSPQCSWSVGVTHVGRGPRIVTTFWEPFDMISSSWPVVAGVEVLQVGKD